MLFGGFRTWITNVQIPQPALTRDAIARAIEERGLKPTEQRVRIAEILMQAPKHITAEQILAIVRASDRPISKATVYNTLKALCNHGLIRQIHLDPERSVYDSTRAPHHHFHDLETGELRDIGPEEIEFSRLPAIPEGMEAEAVEVVIRLRRKRTSQ
jgi:Fur family iron response transcriptional regulator